MREFSIDVINRWVNFWNTYDLRQFENLFLWSNDVTYFSSEKYGLIKGYEALKKHHQGFDFVDGGKIQENRLWLEDLDIKKFYNTVVVCGIWFFKRVNSDNVQKGPVTVVYINSSESWKIAHMNFGNYK